MGIAKEGEKAVQEMKIKITHYHNGK